MREHLVEEVSEDLWVKGKFTKFSKRSEEEEGRASTTLQAGFITIGTSKAPGEVGQLVKLTRGRQWWIIVELLTEGQLRVSEDGRRAQSQVVHVREIVKWRGKKEVVLSIDGPSSALLAWNDKLGVRRTLLICASLCAHAL